jgi:retron-type reverse transcriptase
VAFKHDKLFESIANFHALRTAAYHAVRGKRRKPGAAAFLANLEREVLRLEYELRDGLWKPGGYKTILLRDPKPRMVSAAPFRDRVVHHALCAVIGCIFAKGFIDDSFANRCGKGTHKAIGRYEHFRDRYRYVLRCDIYRYFPAIDHLVLKRDLQRRVRCVRTLALIDRIIDGSNPQEPVNLYFHGDDLFTPITRRRGLPIGNLTSQLFANIYLDGLDHYVKEVLQAPYLRYVDDFALFSDDPDRLNQWRLTVARYLEGRRLVLHPEKTIVQSTATESRFLGFLLLPGGRRRLPEDNVRRFRNRLRGMRDRWRAKAITRDEIQRRIGSWIAHADHAQTWRLRHAIFRAGWFDPVNQLARRPDEAHAAGGFCGAVPGIPNQRTHAQRIATGTNLETETTTTVSELPVRLQSGTGAAKAESGVLESVQASS